MTFVMYDTVTPEVIPASAPVVAGYVGGSWPTFAGLRARFPHARLLAICPQADEDGDALDCEAGDATLAQAPGWFRRQLARGGFRAGKPVIYCSASDVAELIRTMTAAGIARNQYLIWSAHVGFGVHICGPSTCRYPQADGTQWTFTALDRNLDESLLSDAFFPSAKPAPLAGLTPPEKDAALAYLALKSRPQRNPTALQAAHDRVVGIRQAIWRAAVKGYLNGQKVAKGWRLDHRDERYRALEKIVPPGK